MNALVFVIYNMKLRERNMKRRATKDPICLDHIDSDDEWIVEKEDPVLPSDPNWLEDSWLDPNFDINDIEHVPIEKVTSPHVSQSGSRQDMSSRDRGKVIFLLPSYEYKCIFLIT